MIGPLSRLFFSAIAATSNASQVALVNELLDLGATSQASAVEPLRVALDQSSPAYRTLKARGVIRVAAGNRIFLDSTRLDQVGGASNRFILIALLAFFASVALVFWLFPLQ